MCFFFYGYVSHRDLHSFPTRRSSDLRPTASAARRTSSAGSWPATPSTCRRSSRSEEHTSELQSRQYLVCRLLLEKKNYKVTRPPVVQRRSASSNWCRTVLASGAHDCC